MKRIIGIILTFLLLAGCQKGVIEDSRSNYDQVRVVEIMTRHTVTRGTPIFDDSEMTDMGLFCSYTGLDDWTEADMPDKMFNRKLIRENEEWLYEGSPEKWNATSDDDRFTFFAYSPFAATGNGISVNGSSLTQGVPSLTYTVPEDVVVQPDLMVADVRHNVRPADNPVILQMKHALTCVGFQIAGDGNRISGIAIRGVSMTGTLSMEGGEIQWSDLGAVETLKDFSASLNTDEGKNYYTATPTLSADLMKGDGYLMMIPQTLGRDARIIITEEDGNEIEIGLASKEWRAGIRVNYNITIVPGGTVTVTPSELLLPWFGVNHNTENIEVICNDSDGNPSDDMEWSLATESDWFSMTLNSDGSGAGKTVSGKASSTVYTIASENPSTTRDRTTTVYLNDERNDVRVNVRQVYKPDPGVIPGGGDLLPNTYVGAFWHRSYIGERVIKIELGADAKYAGKWSAAVVWVDKNWSFDEFTVSPESSDDPNIFTANPGFCENYKVKVPVGAVKKYATSGVVDKNGTIMFRIGLQSSWESDPRYNATSLPARYAVLVISYNDYSKHQKVFLRQGQGADYLRHPQDAGGNGYMKRFASLNLIALDFPEGKDYVQIYKRGTTDPSTGTSSSRFTYYPSQAGCLFQWAGGPGTERRAYHPVRKYNGTWYSDYRDNAMYWSSIEAKHETCPGGYRRPRYHGTGLASESEFQQSLLTNQSDVVGNSVYGYYADGFFDRRPLETSQAGVVKSCVSSKTKDVAYVGRLFFNNISGSRRENASIFFPFTGYRYYTTGVLNYSGRGAHYWSGTSRYAFDKEDVDQYHAYHIVLSPVNFETRTYSYRAHAFPVRCVAE